VKKRHLLITGLPGTGKTTLMARLAKRMTDLHPAGFLTEEIRVGGIREGFRLVSLDGREGVLAHVGIQGRNRVGRYGVDVVGFESFLADLDLENCDASIVLIDEIGRMESLSPFFTRMVRRLLDSRKIVVATIALKGGGLIAEVKERPDCEVREVTSTNRERLTEELTRWLLVRSGGTK
jgi:nucleoside-triphosphatase